MAIRLIYGLDSATPPRVYTFSAEIAICTHSKHRALRKEETLRKIIAHLTPNIYPEYKINILPIINRKPPRDWDGFRSYEDCLLSSDFFFDKFVFTWRFELFIFFDSASSHWNLAADDDVFLQTVQVVSSTRYGGINQDASGVLEGCG